MANPVKFKQLYEPVQKATRLGRVGVNDPFYLRIDCPKILRNMMICLIENEGIRIDDRDAGDDENCYFTMDVDHNATDLQKTLQDLKIPHTITIENNHEEHDSNHFRYIDGEYQYANSNEYSDLITAHYVLELLEQQAYTALRIHTENRQALAESWDFTEEDIKQAKVLALQWIVKP